MSIRNPYRGSFCGRMPITHSVARSFPQHSRLLLAALPYGILWMGINTKQKYFFVLGWMQIQGSKLKCAWGRTHVRFHHMSSAVDAEDAQNGKKKAGDYLLSHIASHAVPSTQKSLTSEFGMGSGMASSLLSPARLKKRF